MPEALVSVVISSYERPGRLASLLEGLRAQSLARDGFEVIVVDNGSGPATAAVLNAERERGELVLRTVRHDRTRGPAGGRNSGWRLATAPLVAFTDDDCIPEPGWLAALTGAAGTNPGAIVQGRTIPDPDELRSGNGLLTRTVSVATLGPQFETCNIAYPRDLLEAVDGFDESYGLRPAGEDTDLALRAIERGARVTFAADAVVRHAVLSLGTTAALRDATRWGECARLFARHPDARSMLYRGVFWNAWHYLLLRSVAASLGPGWLRRFVLARHIVALRHRARAEGAGPAWIPFLVLYDVIETGSMVRGAVRHRTPLL